MYISSSIPFYVKLFVSLSHCLLHTVHAFIEISEYLLSYPGVTALFSDHFNQGPLESFFGKQRPHGSHCDNQTVKDFLYNTTSLRLQESLAKDPVRGNCRSLSGDVVDDTPLSKRLRHCTTKKL